MNNRLLIPKTSDGGLDGLYITAVVATGYIYVSSDFGASWTQKGLSKAHSGIAINETGQYQSACADSSGKLYISNDYGATWTTVSSTNTWRGIGMNASGQYQTARSGNSSIGGMWRSTDYGVTWAQAFWLSGGFLTEITLDTTGQYQETSNQQRYSNNYGASWSYKNLGFTGYYYGGAMSSDGKYRSRTALNTGIWVSSDFGTNYTLKAPALYWTSIDMSNNGQYQTATVSTGNIYVSSDYGMTWAAKGLSKAYWGVTVSASGQRQAASHFGGYIYVSSDYGNTWTQTGFSANWKRIAMNKIIV